MADAITNSDAIDPAIINCYHAHIYYDDTSRDTAAHLREAIARSFKVELGRWRCAGRPASAIDVSGEIQP